MDVAWEYPFMDGCIRICSLGTIRYQSLSIERSIEINPPFELNIGFVLSWMEDQISVPLKSIYGFN